MCVYVSVCVCRVRPPLPNQSSVVTYPLEGLLAISPPGRRGQEFEFDHVFAPETTQEVRKGHTHTHIQTHTQTLFFVYTVTQPYHRDGSRCE